MRKSLRALCAGVAMLALGALCAAAQTPKYQLILKGGHVIDMANHIDGIRDVAIAHNKIARVAANIPASEAGKVVDVSGYYVVPGLIDIHVHVGNGGTPLDWFTPSARLREQPEGMMDTDILFHGATTTGVDAGTSGAHNYIQERMQIIDHSQARILSWLNIVQDGMFSGLEQNLDEQQAGTCAAMIEQFPNDIVGIKSAHYGEGQNIEGVPNTPWAGIDQAITCGNLTHKPIMLDTSPVAGRSYEDIIDRRLRPGDIHTHVFAQQFPIILPDGKLNPALVTARRKGVIFDLGYGSASFWLRNAVNAIKQGFEPDSLSTDLHRGNLQYLTMPYIMSQMMAAGESFQDVIRQTTVNPAREIHHPELGNLSPGADADIAVLSLEHGKFSWYDDGFARINGTEKIVPVMTLREGAIVYDPSGISMPLWTQAPPQYFGHCPNGESRCRSSADQYPRVVPRPMGVPLPGMTPYKRYTPAELKAAHPPMPPPQVVPPRR